MAINKYVKYSIRGVAILISLFLVLYVIAYIYVSVNKKSIIAQVTEQISNKVNGTIKIGNVDLSFVRTFPQISVLLQKVNLKDTLFEQHKNPFFTADKVYARISIFNVLLKKDPLTGLRVESGNLYMYTDSTGYTNSYLLKGQESNQSKSKSPYKQLTLREIRLENFHITVDNQQAKKLLDFDINKVVCDLIDRDTITRFKTKTDVVVRSLAFNLRKGSFVKNKRLIGDFDIAYNRPLKRLSISKTDITLDEHEFEFAAFFELTDKPQFAIDVSTKQIDVKEGRSLLPEKISKAISIVMLDKPVDVTASVSGPLRGEPLVKVDWVSSANNTVITPFFTFTNCNFSGGYINELIPGLPRKDPNSRLFIKNFTGNWSGLPLRADNVYIDDLVVPKINLDLKSDFPLATLNDILQSKSIDLVSGKGMLDITYSGPLTRNTSTNTFINGSLNIKEGLIQYVPRNIPLKNCNGSITFNKTDVAVKSLTSDVLGNHIVMNGKILNMLSLLGTDPGKTSLDWHVYSPNLNLAALTSLLKKRTKVQRATVFKKNSLASTAAKIDDMLEQSDVNLELNADKLSFKNFTATNVNANIDLEEENWNLRNVSLQNGGGTMKIAGSIKEKNASTQHVALKVNVDNADVNKIMYGFDNFGQDGISYENLKGKLTSDVDISMDLNRDLAGAPYNMDGVINFSLKNGALIDYEPIKKLQFFLFKNRDFENIQFAELKDRFEVKGKDITMNRMEIQSTVLSLFVEGVFSMQGNTDVSIQVPLSNLKKRKEGYKPKNTGSDGKAGASIYLRGTPGDDGNIKFKLDLFKKFRKDDDEKDKKKEKDDGKDKASE